MKRLLVIASAAALIAPAAFAQTTGFEGFSAGANLELSRSTADTGTASDTGNSNALGLQAQYTFGLGNNFVMGVGGSVGTAKRNFSDAGSAVGLATYSKNNMSLDFTPGYMVTPTTMVYGKVSAVTGTLQDDTQATSNTINGVGYGIGVRSMIDKNIYWQAGYDSVKYNDVTDGAVTVAPKGALYSVGIGYKF
jgi:outer membrane immunogenic protein